MKKVMNKINGARVAMMTAVPAFAAGEGGVNGSAICDLVTQMAEVFKMLRVFCFVGAAFMIVSWAWGYISKGDVGMEDLKKKGTALIVGFILLFAIGLIFSFLVNVSNGDYGLCNNLQTAFNA